MASYIHENEMNRKNIRKTEFIISICYLIFDSHVNIHSLLTKVDI